eukprot:GSMAST32.ASY1.ANO1.787.1 assembled CDS
MTDYYSTLGVAKTATDREIKKAFRKLALAHHPDKGGDPEMFKKISEAFATLSDVDKKREYDRYGAKSSRGVGNSRGFRQADADELFRQFFGNQSGASGIHVQRGGFTFVSGGPEMFFGSNIRGSPFFRMSQHNRRRRGSTESSSAAATNRETFRHAQNRQSSPILVFLKVCGMLCCPPGLFCYTLCFIMLYWLGFMSYLFPSPSADAKNDEIVWEL